jgi:hypothetical protein
MTASTSAAAVETVLRLPFREKVSVVTMKEIIQVCLQEKLNGAQYEVRSLHMLYNSLHDFEMIISVLILIGRSLLVTRKASCRYD